MSYITTTSLARSTPNQHVVSNNKLNTSYYLQSTQTQPLGKNKLDISYYLQPGQPKNDNGQRIQAPSSNKVAAPENSLKRYRSDIWNKKQITVGMVGLAMVVGVLALSILINPLISLAIPVILLTEWYAIQKISNIDYKIVNIEENINDIAQQDLKFIPDVTLKDLVLPDLEFVRYILAGGNFEELLQEAERLVNAHPADDEYLANLLRNLQIATQARKEACCRRHIHDPLSYSAEQKKIDMEAACEAFIEFKEKMMGRAL